MGPPVLGSQAIHSPSTAPKIVNVNAQTCMNMSLFKDLLKEYRKADDAITMRLNRSTAQFRDRDRLGLGPKDSSPQDEACLYLWREIVENWKGRMRIINYCVDVVDNVMQERLKGVEGTEAGLDAQPNVRAKLYTDEVLRNQIHNEITVEKIIRQRSIDGTSQLKTVRIESGKALTSGPFTPPGGLAFKSRCKFFEPPESDPEARQW